jgi:hypothetical protein
MLNYSQTPARELERIVEDLTKYLLVDMNVSEEHFAELDKLKARLCDLRPYMSNVEFTKETV